MAVEGKYLSEGGLYRAGANLTAYQFCAVKFTSYTPPSDAVNAGTYVGLASTGGEAIAGILMNTPLQYDSAEVAFIGHPRALAGSGGFSAGDQLVTEAGTGRLVTRGGSGTIVAIALTDADEGTPGTIRLVPTAG